MTRKSRRELARLIEELEDGTGSAGEDVELSEVQRTSIERLYADAQDVLSDEEYARFMELTDAVEWKSQNAPVEEWSSEERECIDLIERVAEARLRGDASSSSA